jgi:hypothetical protein
MQAVNSEILERLPDRIILVYTGDPIARLYASLRPFMTVLWELEQISQYSD